MSGDVSLLLKSIRSITESLEDHSWQGRKLNGSFSGWSFVYYEIHWSYDALLYNLQLVALSKPSKFVIWNVISLENVYSPRDNIIKDLRWSATTKSPSYSTRSMKDHWNVTRDTQELRLITFFYLNLENCTLHNSYMIHNHFLKF